MRGSGIETYIARMAGLPSRCIMKLSARNQLPGKVKAINEGVVTAEVVITLDGGGELIAVITKKSVENLGLAVGKKVYAVVKSTEVMVAID
jgi:molybdopterin-binding protein